LDESRLSFVFRPRALSANKRTPAVRVHLLAVVAVKRYRNALLSRRLPNRPLAVRALEYGRLHGPPRPRRFTDVRNDLHRKSSTRVRPAVRFITFFCFLRRTTIIGRAKISGVYGGIGNVNSATRETSKYSRKRPGLCTARV